MQTADIAKSTQCWCERIRADDLARSAPLTLRPHALTVNAVYTVGISRTASTAAHANLRHSTQFDFIIIMKAKIIVTRYINPYPGSWGVKCPQSTFASVSPNL